MSVAANASLASLPAYRARGLIDRARERATRPSGTSSDLRIKTSSVATDVGVAVGRQPAEGGARALAGDRSRAILILDEPTQGVDVGSKAEIHALMVALAEQRAGDHHDLVGAAGDSRHERPHRRHAGRHDSRRSSRVPPQRRTPSSALRWAMQLRATGRSTDMTATHRRELSVADRHRTDRHSCSRWSAPRFFSPRESQRPLARQPARAARGDRRHARHPDRRDRHLGRLGVRDLRRRRRRGRACRAADRRPSSWSPAFAAPRSARSTAPSSPTSACRRSSSRWRRWWRGGTALRWSTQGAWVQDLPATLPVARAVAASVPARRLRHRRRCCRLAIVVGAADTWRPAARSTRPDPTPQAARLAGFDTRAREVRGVRRRRAPDRAGGAPQRGALQPDSEQRRPRPRDEGHRGGRRRRHGDPRRPRNASTGTLLGVVLLGDRRPGAGVPRRDRPTGSARSRAASSSRRWRRTRGGAAGVHDAADRGARRHA